MILRRLTENLKQQHWTAIAIELVILVLGVFIGMQVSNWNQTLAEKRLGRAYTARLTADLEHDLLTRSALVKYYVAVLKSVETTNDLLADPASDPKSLVINAYRATEYNYRAQSRATWDEIVSSGDTGLLPCGVAVSAAEYFGYDSANNVRDILSHSAYRYRVRTLMPLGLQKALRAGCSDVRDENQNITGFKADCSLAMDPGVILATAQALRTDPVVRESLRYQYSNVYSARLYIKGEETAIEHVLAAIQRPLAIGKPSP